MAANDKAKQMVIENWFRKLVSSDISIADVLTIILKFSKLYEKFDSLFAAKWMKFEKDGTLLIKNDSQYSCYTVFGSAAVVSGHKYHWQIKVSDYEASDINIGIIEVDKCRQDINGGWWNQEYGFSYWSDDGWVYHNDDDREYGDSYGQNDTIDMWLDWKDDKRELSFAKNDKKYGKARDVKESAEYRLAVYVGGDSYKIELISFEMH